MKTYKENDSVVYTDEKGNRIDTFVIFDTDIKTGLTHINHLDLMVDTNMLELHQRSAIRCSMPMNDSFSFELFKQLKEKFTSRDKMKKTKAVTVYRGMRVVELLARAS